MLLVLYDGLFSGENISILGGSVLESGGTCAIYKISHVSALTMLTSCVPATADSRSAEMNAMVNSVFFFTGNPCLTLGFSAVKAFLSRFLDQTGLGVSQEILTKNPQFTQSFKLYIEGL